MTSPQSTGFPLGDGGQLPTNALQTDSCMSSPANSSKFRQIGFPMFSLKRLNLRLSSFDVTTLKQLFMKSRRVETVMQLHISNKYNLVHVHILISQASWHIWFYYLGCTGSQEMWDPGTLLVFSLLLHTYQMYIHICVHTHILHM